MPRHPRAIVAKDVQTAISVAMLKIRIAQKKDRSDCVSNSKRQSTRSGMTTRAE